MSGTYSNAPCTQEGYKCFQNTTILVDFLVILLFYETKIPMVIGRSKCSLILGFFFGKYEISKLHEEWKISPFQVSVGVRFKKWGWCTSILPKCHEVPHNSKIKKSKN